VKREPGLVVSVSDEPIEVLVRSIVNLLRVHEPDWPQVIGPGAIELDAAANKAAVLFNDLFHLGFVGEL